MRCHRKSHAMTVAGSTAQFDAPTSDPYGMAFTTVAIGPLAAFDQRKRYLLGIVAGPEAEAFSMPYVICFMTVNLEMRITVNANDALPGIMIEQLITVVKRLVINNRQWNAVAIDTKVSGTEVDLTTYADRSALAVLMMEIQYRYNYADPGTRCRSCSGDNSTFGTRIKWPQRGIAGGRGERGDDALRFHIGTPAGIAALKFACEIMIYGIDAPVSAIYF